MRGLPAQIQAKEKKTMKKSKLLAAAILGACLTVTAAGCGDAKNDATWGTDNGTNDNGNTLGEDVKEGAEEIGDDIKDGAERIGDDLDDGTNPETTDGADRTQGNDMTK